MGTPPVRRSFMTRYPWVLPVVLAILIAAIVIIFGFGSRIKSALSSPTATPVRATPTPVKATVVITATPGGRSASTPVVVTATPAVVTATATPGGPTPTAVPAGAKTATPGGAGVSTALPHATPVPTVPGLHLGMITYKQSFVQYVQQQATAGNSKYTFYLNPIKVVNTTLPHYGFTQPFKIVQPTTANPTPTPQTDASGRPLVITVVQYQNRYYDVQVVQPGTRGAKGIWLIVTIVQHT